MGFFSLIMQYFETQLVPGNKNTKHTPGSMKETWGKTLQSSAHPDGSLREMTHYNCYWL